VVQERLPFRRAIGWESDAGGDTGSEDGKDDGGEVGADGHGWHV
jgi:hypothetical protein